MLASDLNNPQFVNPMNPDEVLHVEFYWHEPIMQRQSIEQQKVVKGKKMPYVRIMRPGDQTSIIETPVRDDIKARFPQKWLSWQMREGLIAGSGEDAPGWKIDDWPVLTADQKHELKYLRFYTVEQLAGASDIQLQRLGIGGVGLREQAKAAIKKRYREEYEAELKARDQENKDLKERLLRLEALVTQKAEAKQETLMLPKKDK